MRKLFSDTKEKVVANHISMEAIDDQSGKPIVGEIINIFSNILEISQSRPFNKSADYFKNNDVLRELTVLENKLTKKLGINFKMVSCEDIGYSLFIHSDIDNDISFENSEYVYNRYKESKDINLNALYENTNATVKKWKESVTYLQESLNTKLIEINPVNGKVSNLPDGYSVDILFDPFLLINKLSMTAEELTIKLFHEIGHAYLHIASMSNAINMSKLFVDKLYDLRFKKNTSVYSTVKELLKEFTNDEDIWNDNSNKDTTIEDILAYCVKVINIFAKQSLGYLKVDDTNSGNAEYIADDFAKAFGLVEALESCDKKLDNYFGDRKATTLTYLTMTTIGNIVIETALVFIIAITHETERAASKFNLLYTLTSLEYLALFMGIIDGFSYDSNRTSDTVIIKRYTDDVLKLEKISNELVAMVRNSTLSGETLKRMLNDVKTIKNIIGISTLGIQDSTMLNNIYALYTRTIKSITKIDEIKNIVNDTYINIQG